MIKQLIKNIFDSQRKHFSKHGKLEKFGILHLSVYSSEFRLQADATRTYDPHRLKAELRTFKSVNYFCSHMKDET